jgi:tetratricopeptide (TPR) repeat protein
VPLEFLSKQRSKITQAELATLQERHLIRVVEGQLGGETGSIPVTITLYGQHESVRQFALACLAEPIRENGEGGEGPAGVQTAYHNAAEHYEYYARETSHDLADHLKAKDYYLLAGQLEQAVEIVRRLNSALDRMGLWRLGLNLNRELNQLIKEQQVTSELKLDLTARVDLLKSEADLMRNLGQVVASISLYEEALTLAEADHNPLAQGAVYISLGLAYDSLGNFPKAIEFFSKTLAIALQTSDKQSEGTAYANLGYAYISLGDYPKAIEYQKQRLAIALQIGDKHGEGPAYANLGIAYNNLGDFPKAIKFLNKALTIALQIGDKPTEGTIYTNLGIAYKDLGDFPKAIEYQKQRLAIALQIGDKHGEGAAYNILGTAYNSLGDFPKAIEYHFKALTITLQIDDKLGEGRTYGNLGIVYRSLGDFPKAIEFLNKALTIALQIGDKRGEGTAYANLGYAYASLGDFPKTIEFYSKALAITVQIGNKEEEADAYANLGIAYNSLEDYPKAITNTVKASLIFMQIQNPKLQTAFNILRYIRTKLPLTEFEALLNQTYTSLQLNYSQQYRPLLEQAGIFAPNELNLDLKRFVYNFVCALQGKAKALQATQQWIAEEKDSQDWANLTVAVTKLLAGERSKEVLFSVTPTANQNQPTGILEEIDIAIIEKVLAILAQPALLAELEQELDEAGNQAAATEATASGLDPQLEEVAKLIGVAIRGDAQARQMVEQQVLPQMEATASDFHNLAVVVRLMLAGERNPAQLLDPKHNLDEVDQMVLTLALQVAQAYTKQSTLESEEEDEQAGEQAFIGVIVAAVGGNEEATEALNELIEQMVAEPATLKLGLALTKLVAGERDAAKLTKGLDQPGQAIIAKILAALTNM